MRSARLAWLLRAVASLAAVALCWFGVLSDEGWPLAVGDGVLWLISAWILAEYLQARRDELPPRPPRPDMNTVVPPNTRSGALPPPDPGFRNIITGND